MPKVPQVFAGGDTGGGLTPPRAPLALADASGVERGITTLAQAASTFTRATTVVGDENAKIEAELALGEMQRQAADAEIALREDPTVTPENYARKNDENLRAIQQGVGKSMQSPQGRQLFERTSGRFMVQRSIKGKWDGVELGNSQAKSGTDSLLVLDNNVATFGETSAIRDEGYTRGLDRIEKLRRKGIYTGSEAASRETAFRSSVETGRVRLALMDPDQRPAIVMDLLEGRRPYMSADAQLDMADKVMKTAAGEEERRQREFAAWWTREQDAKMLELTQRAEKKDLTIEELDQTSRQWQFKDTDYLRILNVLAAKPKEPGSDPATLQRVIADSHSRYPRMTERNLLDLKTQGLLNTDDWRSALDKRNATIQHLENEGKSDTERAYAQGKQRIKTSLGIPDIMDRVDDPRMGVWSMALDEYDRHAAGARGKVPPEKASDDVVVKYRTLLNDRVNDRDRRASCRERV